MKLQYSVFNADKVKQSDILDKIHSRALCRVRRGYTLSLTNLTISQVHKGVHDYVILFNFRYTPYTDSTYTVRDTSS